MKKQLISICLVVLMMPAFLVTAFANEGYALSPRNLMPENVIARLLELTDASIVDHDPTNGHVDYVSWISYDVLSEMSTGWNTAGVIVYNATMDAYFLCISYMPTVSSDGNMKYCALGTSNGFCYGSKTTISSDVTIDTAGIIQKLDSIYNKLSSFNINSNNLLGRIVGDLADIYYYGDLRLQELIARVQAAGDSLGIIESKLQIHFDNMVADIHSTMLDTTRIRAAAEDMRSYIISDHTIVSEIYREVSTIVSIAGCTGLPDGCDFADISPRCARVLVRDLVAAPSLLTSYAAETVLVGSAQSEGTAYFQLINTSGQSLTVEYITPSPLLNWYASRQDDFRYWLDTRLSSLPVSKSADLTGVISRLDTLIENSASKVENVTNVVIEETNNAYNVFYVTTDDGDKKSIGEVSGDALSASGKLLNFLYKLCFENALSKVDDSITNMDGFYFDNAAGLEGSIWD